MRAAVVVGVLALVATGCVAERASNPEYGCMVDADCGLDEFCERGFCLSRMDAGAALPMCPDECSSGGTCCSVVDSTGTLLGEACTNLASDINNCGGCGVRCDGGQACCGGECIDIDQDENHCGACNRECAAGLECCGGNCVNTRASAEHCNGCGNACTDTTVCCPHKDTSAISCHEHNVCATCDPECDAALEECCGGVCVAVQEDSANCGGCGIACGVGERCCNRTCVSVDMACGGCPPAGGEVCGSNDQCCGDSCVSKSDPNHCGGCNMPCVGTCCGEACVDIQTDNRHCGGCGMVCETGHCSNGHCCPAGLTWCEDLMDCVELGTDVHCGGCGDACSGLFCSCNGRKCTGLVCA